MSKYKPLTEYLSGRAQSHIPMTIVEIEAVLRFKLPGSSRRYRAWWSNNPSNNVMTKAWLAAGYKTESVDLGSGKLVFKRDKGGSPPASPGSGRHPLFGAMKGALTVSDGTDLTQPSLVAWDAFE